MKIEYSQEADTLYIRLQDGGSTESEEIQADIVLDYDDAGVVLGIEIMNASQHTNISEMIFSTLNQQQAA